jgi:uncharacterized membrane protein
MAESEKDPEIIEDIYDSNSGPEDANVANEDASDNQNDSGDDTEPVEDMFEAQLKALEKAEKAVDSAYSTGKAERAKITQSAQLDAAEAVAMVGIAMEADVEADEAMRISVIAEKSGDREKAKAARKKEREARKKAKADHKAATKSAKAAYDAIKFSAPNKMGFMRVVQFLFAGHIAVVLVWLMLTSRDAMAYNVSSIMDWVMVILEGVAFWMFINRFKIARPFVIGMAAIGIIVPVVYDISTGNFNFIATITNTGFYIFLIIYFAFSKRVKATLVNEIGKQKGDYEKEDFVINRRGWPFIRNLIIYFIVFSIIGHWMEMGMCQFIIMGVVQGEYDPTNTMLWRDWLYPFPMEGAAVVVIALVLYPFFQWLKKKFPGKKVIIAYIISFFAGALLCTIIEFSMGLLVNDHYQLWDYRENFCNIMGQVCLQNTAAFGVVAAIITWWVYPLMERWIARVPRDIMNIVFVVVAVFGAIIWSLYLINPPGVDDLNLPENKGKAEEVTQQYDTRMVGAKLAYIDKDIDELENAINATTTLDKEKLTSEAEELRSQLKDMLNETLNLEEYPDAYEQLLVSMNMAAIESENERKS